MRPARFPEPQIEWIFAWKRVRKCIAGKTNRRLMPSAYDEIATDIYESVAVPLAFEGPARDLIAAAKIAPGHVVLDVGTGTGIVARLASEVVGKSGIVIGIDASRKMLSVHEASRSHRLVHGSVPQLPFASRQFDVVVANFVINHFSDYSTALDAMASLVVDGGRLGVSSWADGDNTLVDMWDRVASEFIDLGSIVAAAEETIPSGTHFLKAQNLETALIDAHLTNVQISEFSYMVECSPDQYVSLRSIGRKGTLIRQALNSSQWTTLLSTARATFEAECGQVIEYSSNVLIAVGTQG